MSKLPFRDLTPKRTCTKSYASYGSYKSYLADDFNNRCGYTDSHHRWFGGISTFHIDHFKPHSDYPELKTTYSNLVYACSYVNILKSNDDPINYLDPCATDYNQHFYRDTHGTICPDPQSPQAVHMHKKLKLGLIRYRLIWSLEKSDAILKKLDQVKNTIPADTKEEVDFLRLYVGLAQEFREYLEYLTK